MSSIQDVDRGVSRRRRLGHVRALVVSMCRVVQLLVPGRSPHRKEILPKLLN